jgi:hypothetical protein
MTRIYPVLAAAVFAVTLAGSHAQERAGRFSNIGRVRGP